MPTTPRHAAFTALVLLAAGFAGTRAETVDLAVEIHTRAVAPGEPVRLVVSSPEPLASLGATFLGEPIAMIRTVSADGAAPERWSGWAMVALDGEPGSAVFVVSGATPDGRSAHGRVETEVEDRSFPTEELSVASKYVTPPPDVQERLANEQARLAEIYAIRSPYPPPAAPFEPPVPGQPTSIFGTRRVFNGEPRSPHPGLDLQAGTGEAVHSAGAGTVVVAEDYYYSGNLVIVDHGGGLFTLYAHLSEIGVEEGQRVTQGEIVGRVGATGRVTGPHLHWGAKIGSRPFDPMALVDRALFP
jgi:murein DD-endopeptidase MepM/ murein hydrolase activator NlpD